MKLLQMKAKEATGTDLSPNRRIKEPIDIPRTNITGTRPDRHDYRKFYTTHTRGLVADWYAREIALLGYKF